MKSTGWCFGQKQLKLIDSLPVYGVKINFFVLTCLSKQKMKFRRWSNKNILFIYFVIKGDCVYIYLRKCISTCVRAKICMRQIFSFYNSKSMSVVEWQHLERVDKGMQVKGKFLFSWGQNIINAPIVFQEYLGTLKLEEVTDIDFGNNGYCTDSVIKVILDHKKV